MEDEAELRQFYLLQVVECKNYPHDLLRAGTSLEPIGKKTIAEVFVNNTMATFDDLLASKNPCSNQNLQVLTLYVAAERGKTPDLDNQKPARDILDFAQC